ncbi:MAG: hypothetical protein C0626_13055 [Arcobacter sp.]|uniref:hypothetical protein n=1 Tax=uncultured Arcobacter sp. TaxID=165434 RepID=UPI000CAA19A5|nr:hypothetical protein [uncultured Arcobacter sp.]PLY08767.1 MAG: hypothetical protein C0626_13055 [Arcobacter sp.]
MIILVLLSPFLIALGWVLYVDSSNIDMIEKFYKNESCNTIYNYKSRYKGLCNDNITIINNKFSIDFSKNVYIKYDDIRNITRVNKDILIQNSKGEEKLYFKEKVHSDIFYEQLNKRLK